MPPTEPCPRCCGSGRIETPKWRDPEQIREHSRRYEETRRGTCPSCGGSTDRGTTTVCWDCKVRAKEARWRMVQSLWAEGLTLQQVARVTGRTVPTINTDITRMRKEGWDLPYRYPPRGKITSEA